jgi:ABC-type transport system involved in Fe-S cluster assembly fused permease/ATPase subunit
MTPNQHAERAERIIRTQVLMFALAIAGGKEKDMRDARAILKEAIVIALDEAAGVRPNG